MAVKIDVKSESTGPLELRVRRVLPSMRIDEAFIVKQAVKDTPGASFGVLRKPGELYSTQGKFKLQPLSEVVVAVQSTIAEMGEVTKRTTALQEMTANVVGTRNMLEDKKLAW